MRPAGCPLPYPATGEGRADCKPTMSGVVVPHDSRVFPSLQGIHYTSPTATSTMRRSGRPRGLETALSTSRSSVAVITYIDYSQGTRDVLLSSPPIPVLPWTSPLGCGYGLGSPASVPRESNSRSENRKNPDNPQSWAAGGPYLQAKRRRQIHPGGKPADACCLGWASNPARDYPTA